MPIDKRNLVLVGMPAAGKSTLGVMLAKSMRYNFIDTDITIQVENDATLAELIANVMPGADTCYLGGMGDENYVFGLTFDGQYAHFSFPENVVALGGEEGMMEQITAVSYEYEYDGASHTGHLTVAAEDMDGEETIAPLEFTYDDATDVITFNLPMFYPEDGTPVTLTLNFARNE